jgi:LmbE family N-acetylglucosaminyl deacetylase
MQWTSKTVLALATALLLAGSPAVTAQQQPPIPPPDARFKADILLVVAHPDDDTAVSTYLARAVYDEHKRVAVIFTTRGNSGPNGVGHEQSKALADIRETEGRHSLAARGINNVWFLGGADVPTQDVLHSLEVMGHGAALEEAVRLVRLTRPDVILTWLPAYVAGENHGDHQASGVIATEAFDMANDPVAFAEQLEAPRQPRGISNYGEGLHPWQPKKLYYFSDTTQPGFLSHRGPVYLASDRSAAKGMLYSEINHIAWQNYATQIDFDQKTVDYFCDQPDRLLLGKSMVPANPTADVWENAEMPARAATPATPAATPTGLTMVFGGPWHFYQQFYAAHQLAPLEGLVPPATALGTDRQLWVPLLLENHTAQVQDVTLQSKIPAGWKEFTGPGVYHLQPGESYPVQVFLIAPPEDSKPANPVTLAWTATANGEPVAALQLAAFLEFDGVGQ